MMKKFLYDDQCPFLPTTRSLLLALLQPVEECVPLPPHLLRVGRGLPHRPLVHPPPRPGGNCIKIGLPGKLILSKRKGLREVIFS